jgi:hypothetical protein
MRQNGFAALFHKIFNQNAAKRFCRIFIIKKTPYGLKINKSYKFLINYFVALSVNLFIKFLKMSTFYMLFSFNIILDETKCGK